MSTAASRSISSCVLCLKKRDLTQLDGDALFDRNVAEVDLDLGQGQHVPRGRHAAYEGVDDAGGTLGSCSSRSSCHKVGEGLSGVGRVRALDGRALGRVS